jgi:hypothetical protein
MSNTIILIDGKPVFSIAGLSATQARELEAAAKIGMDASWHDEVVRDVQAWLRDKAPWSDAAVRSAIAGALANRGILYPEE